MDHLRYSGAGDAVQRQVLETIIREQPVLMAVLAGLRDLALPDHLLVAGAIYNHVWNILTDRPPLAGINDIDVFYFDDSDIGWDAEDLVIRRCAARFGDLPLPVQVRNQARVHLWFEQKFGIAFAPLASSSEMIGRYASRPYAIGAWLDDHDAIQIVAPFGLDDLFSFLLTPNPALNNRVLHNRKGETLSRTWPELVFIPWPHDAA